MIKKFIHDLYCTKKEQFSDLIGDCFEYLVICARGLGDRKILEDKLKSIKEFYKNMCALYCARYTYYEYLYIENVIEKYDSSQEFYEAEKIYKEEIKELKRRLGIITRRNAVADPITNEVPERKKE